MDLGPVGVWNAALRGDQPGSRAEIVAAVRELEELGYGAIWIGGSPGVGHAASIVEVTSRIVVATGIASIWSDPPGTVAAQCAELARAHPGRFLLGLGASHSAIVPEYRRPYSAMVAFLDGLDAAETPVPPEGRVLAALGPRMLELAKERSLGAHPYLVTPEHTAIAREALGADRVLAPEVKVVLETDPARARERARNHLAMYMRLPNYTRNLLRLGFAEEDFAGGGSDHLVDNVVAWGSAESIVSRLAEYTAAGADHLVVQAIPESRNDLPRRDWRELANALGLA